MVFGIKTAGAVSLQSNYIYCKTIYLEAKQMSCKTTKNEAALTGYCVLCYFKLGGLIVESAVYGTLER